MQKCLQNDKTVIKNLQWKFNYQLNAANKFQYLFQSDNKFRNARGASAKTAKEATTEQTSDKPWGFPLPTHSLTHTLIATDKLVFNNQFTYVHGGFFLDYQDVPPQGDLRRRRRYLGITDYNDYLTGDRADPNCLFNQQSLSNHTTGFNSRSLDGDVPDGAALARKPKTDGTYFLTNMLGGDHSLKFGVGWRKNPIMTFSHYSGGARAQQQCVGNNRANCGDGATVPVGLGDGLRRAYQAILYRDQLLNNDWWTYNGYIQDSYSRGRLRINGGLRYDWQQSKYLGGCVPNNPLMPDLLPAQCEDATDIDPVTGKKIQSFSNWGPRVSVDLRPVRQRQDVGARQRLVLLRHEDHAGQRARRPVQSARADLGQQPEQRRVQHDGRRLLLDRREPRRPRPGQRADRHPDVEQRAVQPTTGVFAPAGNTVDPSAKIGRTREVITGMQHELMPNLAVGADYIYRKYDRGTTTYIARLPSRARRATRSRQIYTDRLTYTDPVTGHHARRTTCRARAATAPTGLGTIT